MSISDTYIIPAGSEERFIPLTVGPAAPLVEAGVKMAGLSDLRAPYEIARGRPGQHVVLVTLAGRARLETVSFSGNLTGGSAVVLPAGEPHRYFARGRWRFAWFHLDDSIKWSFAKHRIVRIAPAPGAPRIAEAMAGFLEECLTDDASESSRAARAYADVIAVMLRRQVGRDPGEGDQVVRWELSELWRRVASDLSRRWTVPELADRFGVSPGHLHRLTLQFHRSTPMGVVTRLRIERIAELLRGGEFTLAAIAPMVGYDSPFALSRAYKRVTGRSPRARP